MPTAALTLAAALAAATSGSLNVGDKLVPFSLKDYAGKSVDLKAFDGKKAVVLMFIATECPVSNAYNDRMAALAKDYSAKGVAIVGINANRAEDTSRIAEHAKQHGLEFPILKDVDNLQADRFGAQVTPETFVFDNSWTLRYHGRIDDNQKGDNIQSQDLRNALEAVLAGKEIAVKETKAFGCTIKRVQK
jgi:peroxiredoxin